MTSSRIESYLRELRRELRQQFITDPRIIDEVRGHLTDAVEAAHAQGSVVAAETQSIERFGSPALVAAAFVADRTRVLHRWLLAAASLVGIAIAFADARPGWDDAGITAGTMAMVAAVLGIVGPQRPWRWALAVGLWIPAYALVRTPAVGSVAMLLVLMFPLAGAYLGRVARSVLMAVSS